MPSSENKDNRHFHRIAHDAPAVVSLGDEVWKARTLDLSLKGCLLELGSAPTPAIGDPCLIAIHLNEEIQIAMTATLVHRENGRAGFKCEHIDLDSVSTLRRLVELNLGDPELLDRDLEALAGGPETQAITGPR